MTTAPTITVPLTLAIHRGIESRRKTFEEEQSDILRRILEDLFGTDPDAPAAASDPPPAPLSSRAFRAGVPARALPPPAAGGDRVGWSQSGVNLPHGTELRMEHHSGEFFAKVEHGSIVTADGTRYHSLSPAASHSARTRYGHAPALNGWTVWSAKRPGESSWTPLEVLRNRARGRG